MKLKRAAYRHVEAEIYAYDDTMKAIEDLRQDILLSGRQDEGIGMVSGGDPAHSVVERRATKLADSVLLREMERITGAIRDTYARTKNEVRRIIWVKYGLAIGWQVPEDLLDMMRGRNRADVSYAVMAGLLGIDESTFYRYRSGFVYGIAEHLGWY